MGSDIGSLRCANLDCFGFIFPNNPLNLKTTWSCRECKRKVSNRQVQAVRSGITAIINEVLVEPPRKILKFIEGELNTLVPETNHFMADTKFRMISFYGRTDDLQWKGLSLNFFN